MNHFWNKMCMEDIIGFFTDVNKTELRDRIVDESNDNEVSVNEEETVIDETKIDDDVDNIPLAAVLDNTQNTSFNDNTNLHHHCKWRKRDTIHGDNAFVQSFSDPQDKKEIHCNILQNSLLIRS